MCSYENRRIHSIILTVPCPPARLRVLPLRPSNSPLRSPPGCPAFLPCQAASFLPRSSVWNAELCFTIADTQLYNSFRCATQRGCTLMCLHK